MGVELEENRRGHGDRVDRAASLVPVRGPCRVRVPARGFARLESEVGLGSRHGRVHLPDYHPAIAGHGLRLGPSRHGSLQQIPRLEVH